MEQGLATPPQTHYQVVIKASLTKFCYLANIYKADIQASRPETLFTDCFINATKPQLPLLLGALKAIMCMAHLGKVQQ